MTTHRVPRNRRITVRLGVGVTALTSLAAVAVAVAPNALARTVQACPTTGRLQVECELGAAVSAGFATPGMTGAATGSDGTWTTTIVRGQFDSNEAAAATSKVVYAGRTRAAVANSSLSTKYGNGNTVTSFVYDYAHKGTGKGSTYKRVQVSAQTSYDPTSSTGFDANTTVDLLSCTQRGSYTDAYADCRSGTEQQWTQDFFRTEKISISGSKVAIVEPETFSVYPLTYSGGSLVRGSAKRTVNGSWSFTGTVGSTISGKVHWAFGQTSKTKTLKATRTTTIKVTRSS